MKQLSIQLLDFLHSGVCQNNHVSFSPGPPNPPLTHLSSEVPNFPVSASRFCSWAKNFLFHSLRSPLGLPPSEDELLPIAWILHPLLSWFPCLRGAHPASAPHKGARREIFWDFAYLKASSLYLHRYEFGFRILGWKSFPLQSHDSFVLESSRFPCYCWELWCHSESWTFVCEWVFWKA